MAVIATATTINAYDLMTYSFSFSSSLDMLGGRGSCDAYIFLDRRGLSENVRSRGNLYKLLMFTSAAENGRKPMALFCAKGMVGTDTVLLGHGGIHMLHDLYNFTQRSVSGFVLSLLLALCTYI